MLIAIYLQYKCYFFCAQYKSLLPLGGMGVGDGCGDGSVEVSPSTACCCQNGNVNFLLQQFCWFLQRCHGEVGCNGAFTRTHTHPQPMFCALLTKMKHKGPFQSKMSNCPPKQNFSQLQWFVLYLTFDSRKSLEVVVFENFVITSLNGEPSIF